MKVIYVVVNPESGIEHEIAADGASYFYVDNGVYRAVSQEKVQSAIKKAEELGWEIFDYR